MARYRGNGVRELTKPQRQELLGPWSAILDDLFESTFANEEHRRAAWEAYGEQLTEEFIRENPGRRPVAWWHYDADRRPPTLAEDRPPGAPTDLQNEAAWLWQLGVLTPEERARCRPPSPAERAHIGRNDWGPGTNGRKPTTLEEEQTE